MNTIMKKSLIWTPRVLCVLFAMLLSMFALVLAGCQTSQQPASLTANDTVPQPTYRVAPVIPPELKQQKVEEGNAVIEFVVGPQGNITKARVLSTTHPSFGEASRQAALQWQFVPGTLNGVPTACRMKLPFKFSIPQEPKETTEQDGSGNDG